MSQKSLIRPIISCFVNAARKAAFLAKGCASIPAILPLRDKSKIGPSIVPRVVIDVVDDHIDRNILAHKGECESVCTVKDAFTRSPALRVFNFRANADLDCGAVIAPFSAFLGTSFRSGKFAIPRLALLVIRKVTEGSFLPSQNSSFRIVGKALFQKSFRKCVDVFDWFSGLTGDRTAVFSNRLFAHGDNMGVGFSVVPQFQPVG